jgi:hypothetical protein
MSEFKKFKSTSEDIYISNTIGHCSIIGKEWSIVHKSLWGDAYAKGAIPEEATTTNLKSYVAEQRELKILEDTEKEKLLKTKLLEIYNNPNGFTNTNGDLLLRKVSGYLKEPIKADLILKVWDEIVAENK